MWHPPWLRHSKYQWHKSIESATWLWAICRHLTVHAAMGIGFDRSHCLHILSARLGNDFPRFRYSALASLRHFHWHPTAHQPYVHYVPSLCLRCVDLLNIIVLQLSCRSYDVGPWARWLGDSAPDERWSLLHFAIVSLLLAQWLLLQP